MNKDICKDIFVNRYKQSNIIKDLANFLKKIEELKPYTIKFNQNNIMKSKIYPFNYAIEGENS